MSNAYANADNVAMSNDEWKAAHKKVQGIYDAFNNRGRRLVAGDKSADSMEWFRITHDYYTKMLDKRYKETEVEVLKDVGTFSKEVFNKMQKLCVRVDRFHFIDVNEGGKILDAEIFDNLDDVPKCL